MQRQVFLPFLFLISFSGIKAQKGNNTRSITAEAAIPDLQKANGGGLYAKGSYGVGKSGQITITIGFSVFHSNDSINDIEKGSIKTSVIPILLGYKQKISRFFIEPKIGLGGLSGRFQLGGNGDFSNPSATALFGSISTGYTIQRLNAGINFLMAQGIDNVSGGTWHDKNFRYVSVSSVMIYFQNKK